MALQFDLQTFACGHVGFSSEYQPSKLKEKLKPAIAELVAIGFIEDLPIDKRYTKVAHGQWQINFTRKRSNLLENLPLKGTKTERSNNRILIKELVDRGMTLVTARNLVEDPNIDHQLIRDKIELLDWMIASKDVESPARPGGWLRKAIEENYQAPKGFSTLEERMLQQQKLDFFREERERKKSETEKQEQLRLEQERAREQSEWQQVQDYLASLSATDGELTIDAAINDPENGFLRDFANKYRVNPDPTGSGEIMFQMALKKYILPLIEKSEIPTTCYS